LSTASASFPERRLPGGRSPTAAYTELAATARRGSPHRLTVTPIMHAPRKASLLWSGGKDSALALHHIQNTPSGIRINRLVTCVSRAFDRVSMHGVRRELIAAQAAALGLPVEFVVIPPAEDPTCPPAHSTPGTTFPPNDVYSAAMLAAFARLKADGVEVIAFGDIYLADLRAYRDALLKHAGLEGAYPLWGRDTGELYDEFGRLGFRAVTVCVDTARLTDEHLGRELDPAFRTSLPPESDPCGERGEYHSFAFAGPTFTRPVAFTPGDVHRQPPFAFLELFPAKPVPVEA
jgi:uncharacterized protein (TIGR00290 family)